MLGNSFMRFLLSLSLVVIVSCSTRYPRVDLLPKTLEGPYHGDLKVFNPTTIQIPNELSEIIIAEGNGLVGYQSVKVSSDSHVEVRILEKTDSQAVFVYTAPMRSGFFRSLVERSVKKLDGLKKGYSTSVAGGSTAIVTLKGQGGRTEEIYMSNYFPAEVEKLWHEIRSEIDEIGKSDWKFVRME